MNIAFTSILLFLILVPGFILRLSYRSSKYSVKNLNRGFISELTYAIVPAILLQFLAISFANHFTDYKIDFEVLGYLVLGVDEKLIIQESFRNIRDNLSVIFAYNILLFIFAGVFGQIGLRLVRYYRWDRIIPSFRFSNRWSYILSGECLDFPDVPDTFEQVYYTTVDVLTELGGKKILYTGELFHYYIDVHGDLKEIHLRYPERRDFDISGAYYKIKSRFIIIPNSSIINMNINYIAREEVPPEEIKQVIEKESRKIIIDVPNNSNQQGEDQEDK